VIRLAGSVKGRVKGLETRGCCEQLLACEWVSFRGIGSLICGCWGCVCRCRRSTADAILSIGAEKRPGVWVTMQGAADCFDDEEEEEGLGLMTGAGQVLVQFELLPVVLAETRKVGEGRTAPNLHPMLPEPEREKLFSVNPFIMLKSFLGPGGCAVVLGGICCLLAVPAPSNNPSSNSRYRFSEINVSKGLAFTIRLASIAGSDIES